MVRSIIILNMSTYDVYWNITSVRGRKLVLEVAHVLLSFLILKEQCVLMILSVMVHDRSVPCDGILEVHIAMKQ